MSSLADIQHLILRYNRTDITVSLRSRCKRKQTVKNSYLSGIYLYGRNKLSQRHYQLVINTCLQRKNLVLGPKDFLFVFLQFLSDVSFGIHKSLFSYPFGRNLILMCITNLYIIAEHVIISNLKAWNTRKLAFSLLNLKKIIFSGV